MTQTFAEMTADEAAALIQNGQTIGFSGFTPAGAAKVIPKAIAARARAEHAAERAYKVNVVTGASTGDSLDGELARANAVGWRTPYQSNKDMRASINRGDTRFFDMHLSLLPQYVRYGFLGNLDWAIVEACDVTEQGEIVLTTSVGATPTFCSTASKILVELNEFHPSRLRGLHDIYEPANPPLRREIPIYRADDAIGREVIKVSPEKIVGIVRTNEEDETGAFNDPDAVTLQIGDNVARFLAGEIRAGRVPKEFLPIQSGVGNVANAVLGAMGAHPDIPAFQMYSEVIQDSVVALMEQERIRFASGTSITVSQEVLKRIYDNIGFFKDRILLRPQEISNNPEIVRRLGIITVNTALEVDVFGNVNSTHVMGRSMMNGIGGSGDFTRNAYISIFTCPSLAKKGAISPIVPHVSHIDHSEHSVNVIITEQGVADLRGKAPHERAEAIVSNCAHPDFREELRAYYATTLDGHTPETLQCAFAMHQQFLKTGNMRGVNFSELLNAD
ncbi:MAG: succinate CoA transferase [Opitutales bacterium]